MLSFPKEKILQVQKGKISTVVMNVDINKFWDAERKISDTPVCTSPGILAKQMAGNFSKLFNIAAITNEK